METNGQPHRPLVEVCIGSISDAAAASAAGADRVELCGATELGGLTPSAGLLEQVIHAISLPVIVMIRPRAGGFCYSRAEFATALRDAEFAIEWGAEGIAFGILTADGQIDAARCRELVAIAGQRQTVFHRAFDFVPNALAATDQLVELGMTRVLTSGQRATALEGVELLRILAQRTAGMLEVMPGGGIRAEHVVQIAQHTRCNQIHVGASVLAIDGSLAGNRHVNFAAASTLTEGSHRAVQPALVIEIVNRLEHSLSRDCRGGPLLPTD